MSKTNSYAERLEALREASSPYTEHCEWAKQLLALATDQQTAIEARDAEIERLRGVLEGAVQDFHYLADGFYEPKTAIEGQLYFAAINLDAGKLRDKYDALLTEALANTPKETE